MCHASVAQRLARTDSGKRRSYTGDSTAQSHDATISNTEKTDFHTGQCSCWRYSYRVIQASLMKRAGAAGRRRAHVRRAFLRRGRVHTKLPTRPRQREKRTWKATTDVQKNPTRRLAARNCTVAENDGVGMEVSRDQRPTTLACSSFGATSDCCPQTRRRATEECNVQQSLVGIRGRDEEIQ